MYCHILEGVVGSDVSKNGGPAYEYFNIAVSVIQMFIAKDPKTLLIINDSKIVPRSNKTHLQLTLDFIDRMVEVIAVNSGAEGISFKDNIILMKILSSLLENTDCSKFLCKIADKLFFWLELTKRKNCPRAFKSMAY